MSTQFLLYVIYGILAVFAIIVTVYFILKKKMNKSEYQQIRKLRQGTETNKFSKEILYQKLYLTYSKIPYIKTYIFKLRRRLEIINVDDEYATRRDSAKIMTRVLFIVIPIMTLSIIATHTNYLLMSIILIFELFMVDAFIDASVDGLDNNLLKQQLDFFAEIRHAYHEFNMVEEAIYQISQDDEKTISKQGEKIYEVLISNDPETELEKYYDIAPNPYLKEFAGISYLTKEFGDRKVDKASLYLKNVNNITEEMQIEILKRDKIDYVFQSLSIISIVPVLFLEPLKNWSINNFNFTEAFYQGKPGMIVQILVILLTVICYVLLRRVKNNGSTDKKAVNMENPWQAKVYKNPIGKRIVNMFLPKNGTKEYLKVQKLLKDSASKLKMEWFYINRLVIGISTFVVTLFLTLQLHYVSVKWVYDEPTYQYNLLEPKVIINF